MLFEKSLKEIFAERGRVSDLEGIWLQVCVLFTIG